MVRSWLWGIVSEFKWGFYVIVDRERGMMGLEWKVDGEGDGELAIGTTIILLFTPVTDIKISVCAGGAFI